VMGTPLD